MFFLTTQEEGTLSELQVDRFFGWIMMEIYDRCNMYPSRGNKKRAGSSRAIN